jgi:hypothetical protein
MTKRVAGWSNVSWFQGFKSSKVGGRGFEPLTSAMNSQWFAAAEVEGGAEGWIGKQAKQAVQVTQIAIFHLSPL